MEARILKCINEILDRLPTAIDTVDPQNPKYDETEGPQTKWVSEATTPVMMISDETLYFLL